MAPKDTTREANFKVDIPKFHGGISSDSFLDWLVDVEEILEFQSVSEDQLVTLVVKKFRGQAASWWQQVKKTRKRARKNLIKSWDKLKQKLCVTFLPRHYNSLVSNRLKNLQPSARSMDDYSEDCSVKVKDVVDEPLYDVDGDNLSAMKFAADGDSILDIKDDGDVVDVEAKEDDVMDLENNDVIVGLDNDKEFVNTIVNDDVNTLANGIGNLNVFVSVVEDCDSPDDPSQDEGASLDVTKVGDLVDIFNPIDVFSDVFSPVNDGCEEDVNNADVIGNQVVVYTRLSTMKYELVIPSLGKEEEESYMDEENHNYSIYLAHRHQKINGEPPDRGRSVILFSHGEVDLYNKISGTLVSNIYKGENQCYYDLYVEILEGEVIEFAKPLVFFLHCGSTREDFHAGYMSNQQDERIYMCSSTTVFMNWNLGHEKPMKIQSCHQLDVYDEDVNIIIPIIFFITNGAVNTNKWDFMNFGVEYSMMVMLFSREMKDVSYAGTNTMNFLLNVYEAITTITCEGRRIFLLLFDIRELKSKDAFTYQLTLHEQITVLASNKESREHPLTQISMDLGKVTLVEDRTSCLETFARRLAFPFGSFMVYLFDASLRTRWKRRVVCISYLGHSVRTTTGLTWENELLCRNENDIGKLFKDQTSSEAHLLVVVDSFKILIANDVLEAQILHHQKFIDLKSTITWVLVVFRHHAFPPVLFVPIISFTIELHCRAFKWIIGVLPHPLLDSNYIFTTFICWSDVACESRKLLTCGKLSLVVPCFSTNVRFVVGKETTNAHVVALMWKLHALRLGINSSSHTLPKITHGLLKKKTNAVDVRWKLFDSSLDMHSAFHPHTRYKASNVKRRDVVFDPCDLVCILFANDRLPPHEYQKASAFSSKIEISVFIFPQRVFEIRHGDTLNLSFRDKRTRLHMLPATIGWIYKIYEVRSFYKENEGLLVTCVQGSLDGLIVLTKVLYEIENSDFCYMNCYFRHLQVLMPCFLLYFHITKVIIKKYDEPNQSTQINGVLDLVNGLSPLP